LVAGILTHAGLNPETLTLEVTETALMSDADAALGVLHSLKSPQPGRRQRPGVSPDISRGCSVGDGSGFVGPAWLG